MAEFVKLQLSMTRAREVLKPLLAKPKKGVPKVTAISNEEYEESLSPLFDYFDTCVSTSEDFSNSTNLLHSSPRSTSHSLTSFASP